MLQGPPSWGADMSKGEAMSCLAILIVIMQETWRKGKAHQGLYFSWVATLSLGVHKSKSLHPCEFRLNRVLRDNSELYIESRATSPLTSVG
jgi:hypothetical protein